MTATAQTATATMAEAAGAAVKGAAAIVPCARVQTEPGRGYPWRVRHVEDEDCDYEYDDCPAHDEEAATFQIF